MDSQYQIVTTIPPKHPDMPWNWSGAKAVPTIGERVTITFNELGAGSVIGYKVTDGYLGVWVKLDRSPDWRVGQGYGDDVPALIYGAELVEQRAPEGTSRAIGVRLQYAPANVRALVVNALRDKAATDRHYARCVDESGAAFAAKLIERADLADQLANEFEAA